MDYPRMPESMEEADPRFRERFEQRDAVKKRHRRLGNLRLASVGAGLALLWWVEAAAPAYTWFTVACLVAAYIASTKVFSKLEDSILYLTHAALLYGDPLAGRGLQGSEKDMNAMLGRPADHPFVEDLDILSAKGLFDAVNIGSTHAGMCFLFQMLSTPVGGDMIRARQAAAAELKDDVDLRERFYVAGSLKTPLARTMQMLAWANKEPVKIPAWLPRTCAALSCGAVLSGVAAAISPSAATVSVLGAFLLAEFAVWQFGASKVEAPSLEAERIHVDFAQFGAMLKILDGRTFRAQLLQNITEALHSDGISAVKLIERFCRIVSLHEARGNQIVAMLGPLVLYQTQLALAMERWRSAHGPQLAAWIQAVAQFEGYSSLARFAFERPGYSFPKIEDDGPVLRASALAHPLIREGAVANDVTLDPERPILLVSGANMAGKSTLLRTIGVTLALTYAGGPVRASAITVSPMALVASIRARDSLERGESRFSWELKRIQLMLESIREGKQTLVLIDELFGGTNSYDRYAGAVGFTEFVLKSDVALAVLSTHDRHVTHWAEENGGRILNVHFLDVFEKGEMAFDYKLRPGAAQRGNAAKLMREAGIPIPAAPPPPGA